MIAPRCAAGDHTSCPGRYLHALGTGTCTCPCHHAADNEEQEAAA